MLYLPFYWGGYIPGFGYPFAGMQTGMNYYYVQPARILFPQPDWQKMRMRGLMPGARLPGAMGNGWRDFPQKPAPVPVGIPAQNKVASPPDHPAQNGSAMPADLPEQENAAASADQPGKKKAAASSLLFAGLRPEKQAKPSFKASDFTSELLTDEDLEQIISLVGSRIEDVFDLAPGQKWMFEKARTVSSAFFLQILLKAKIPLKASLLREKVDEVMEHRANLRSVYPYHGLSRPYRVVLRNRPAEIRFEDLSDLKADQLDKKLDRLMQADRRRGFNLEKDVLLRIYVYRIAGDDSFAIILSQPHINTDGTSLMLLMKDIFVDYTMEMEGLEQQLPDISYKAYAAWLESCDLEKELAYWKDYLQDLTQTTRIPGLGQNTLLESKMETEHFFFCEETQAGLKRLQSAGHVTQNSIMQAAWSLMLMKMYNASEAVFGAIISGRDAQVPGSALMAGGFVNALTVRAKTVSEDETVQSFIRRLQTEFMTSVQNSHCTPEEVQKALGKKEPLFDHLLNFHNFAGILPQRSISGENEVSGIHLMDMQMYDNLSMNLTVYFEVSDGKLECRFVYNRNLLSHARISILMNCFEQVVDQIAQGGPDKIVGEVTCPDISIFAQSINNEDERREQMISFMAGLDLMNGLKAETLRELAGVCSLNSYLQDDIIIRERNPADDLYIVYKGFVELGRKGADGWNRTLMTLKAGKLISAAGLWEEQHSYLEARAISDALVLIIPKEQVYALLEKEPVFGVNLMRELDKRAGIFSLLWINSE